MLIPTSATKKIRNQGHLNLPTKELVPVMSYRDRTPGASAEDLGIGKTNKSIRSLRRHRSYQSLTAHSSFTKTNSNTKRKTNRTRPPIPEFNSAPDKDDRPDAADMSAPEPDMRRTSRQSILKPTRGFSTNYSAPRTNRANANGRASAAAHVNYQKEPLTILPLRPARSRSNSDTLTNASPSASLKRMSTSRKSLPFVSRRTGLDAVLRDGPGREKGGLDGALSQLRYLILTSGIDSDGEGMVGNSFLSMHIDPANVHRSPPIVYMFGSYYLIFRPYLQTSTLALFIEAVHQHTVKYEMTLFEL